MKQFDRYTMSKYHYSLQLAVYIYLTTLVLAQNETHAATPTGDFLYSPGYIFNLAYKENSTYDYFVETNYVNHTLSLRVVDCEIEHEDKAGLCLYDKLLIYDGYNDSATQLAEFCCPDNNYPTYYTTGSVAYLVFTTDYDNNYKGFKIEFKSEGLTTTTSTSTTTTTTLTTTTTTKTTTTVASTTASTAPTNVPKAGDDGGSGSNIYIIIGCILAILVLIAIIIIAFCCWKKNKRAHSADSESVTKRVLWSRSNTTVVKPMDEHKNGLPPGNVVQTNIFDLELPTSGAKGNLLPPLSPPVSSVLYPTNSSKQNTITEIDTTPKPPG